MDLETAQKKSLQPPKPASHWRLLTSHGIINDEVLSWHYEGSGTDLDPYVVKWIENDPRDPMHFPSSRKWVFTMISALTLFIVTLASSGYTGGIPSLMQQLEVSQELAIAGVSLYVVGFAVGPIFWGPFSEVAGRQLTHFTSYFIFAAFNGGVTAAQNIETVLVCRFLAGSFGAASMTNAGAVVADMFPPRSRGLAMTFFAAAPFLGPVLGMTTNQCTEIPFGVLTIFTRSNFFGFYFPSGG
jgi:MFS family permease